MGDDLFGQQTISRLKNEGILTDYVLIDSRYPSGVALITVDEGGENTIVVASGANMALGEREILATINPIEQTTIILLQLEIPLQTVELAAKTASNLGKTVILNPAPAYPL